MASIIAKRTKLHGPQSLLSLDIGTKNFSYCWLNIEDLSIQEWGNTSMSELIDNPKGLETSALFKKFGILPVVTEFAIQFESKFDTLFEQTQWIVVEDQIKAQMRVVQAIIYSHFRARARKQWEEALLPFTENGLAYSTKLRKNGKNPVDSFAIVETMHPRVTKQHFGYSELGYGDRKEAAMLYSQELFKTNVLKPSQWASHFESSEKRDDLADSLLQGICFSNRLKGDEPEKVICSEIDNKPKISKSQRRRKM